MNQHKRQGSSGSFSIDPSLYASFSSLENFMVTSKLMQDEIMVPSKLKDKQFDVDTMNTINNIAIQKFDPITDSQNNNNNSYSSTLTDTDQQLSSSDENNNSVSMKSANKKIGKEKVLPDPDILEHYRFIILLRNQFTQAKPFLNNTEDENAELRFKNFNIIFNNLKYHYKELMSTLDSLSSEAKAIVDIYRENI